MAFITVFTHNIYSSKPSVYAKEKTVVQEQSKIKNDSDYTEDFLELQQEYIEEIELYSDRYIIMNEDGSDIKEDSLIDTAKDAYDDGAENKKKREDQWKTKLRKADAQNYKQWNEAQESMKENDKNNGSKETVYLEELSEEQNNTGVLIVEEAIEPQDFIESMEEELQDSGAIIQPDYKFELASVVEKTDFEKEIFTSEEVVYTSQPEFEKAWDVSSGNGITIAVIDTGIDISHPEIKDHIVEGYNFCDNTTDVFDEEDAMSQVHGTHIAGIIAKAAPNAKIMPLQVFDNGEAYTSDIIRAIEYAKEHGADIVNMSFGSSEGNLALYQAMEASDMFYVCAAGNGRKNISEDQVYPASYALDNSISVGAVISDGNMAYFSNYGEAVDIAALGKNIKSTFPDGSYGTMSGTSMSAAYVSAAAALTASVTGTEELKAALINGADHLSCLNGKIANGNRLNVINAVKRFDQTEETMVEEKEDEGSYLGSLSDKERWELFSAVDNVKIESFYHTLVLKNDGTVWAWGSNDMGGLGDGTKESRNAPVQVVGLANVVDIAVGMGTSYALKSDGSVWAWGANNMGQLGDAYNEAISTVPVKVLAEDDTKVTAITAGSYSAMALKEDGTVWEWGNTYLHGQIGYPMQISQLADVKNIAMGGRSEMVIKKDGSTWAWGNNTEYQLGNGTTTEQTAPVKISGLSNMTQIKMGYGNWNVGISSDGTLWEWGNRNGTKISRPRLVKEVGNVSQISVCYRHVAAVTKTGKLYVWGDNYSGQIGNGSENSNSSPVPIQLSSSVSAVKVAAGMDTTIALASDNTIWTWGSNAAGRLGDGLSIQKRSTPAKISFMPGLYSEECYNTTFDNALQISKDDVIADAIRTGGEYRYYKFVPKVTANYAIGTISRFDTYGYLYDENHKQLASNDDGYKKGDSTYSYDFFIRYHLKAGKTYYIGVRAYAKSVTDNYKFYLHYYDDHGNTIAEATSLLFNTNTKGEIDYPGDLDMFSFTASVTGIYNVQSFPGIDTYGYLYDSAGKLLAQNDDAGKNSGYHCDFHMQYLMQEGQLYYVGVRAYSSTNTGAYKVKISYEDDYSDEIDGAADISAKYMTEGMIQHTGDVDTFRFVPQKSGIYYFTTNGSLLQTKKTLYDASGKKLIENGEKDANGIIRLTYELVEGNTYYIQSESESAGALGSYTFYIEQPFDIVIE